MLGVFVVVALTVLVEEVRNVLVVVNVGMVVEVNKVVDPMNCVVRSMLVVVEISVF